MQLNINIKRKLMYEITSLQSYCVLLSRIELPIIVYQYKFALFLLDTNWLYTTHYKRRASVRSDDLNKLNLKKKVHQSSVANL